MCVCILFQKILTALEVSLGDVIDLSRSRGNRYIEDLVKNHQLDVAQLADDVLRLIPTIFLYVKENTLETLELLKSKLFSEIPFLRDSSVETNAGPGQVSLPKTVTTESMDAIADLCKHANSVEVTQSTSDDLHHHLGQLATNFAFHVVDDDAEFQHSMQEQSVNSMLIKQLLQYSALLCRFAGQFAQSVRRLHVRSIAKLRQTILDDVQEKHAWITLAMEEIQTKGRVKWPTCVAASMTARGVGTRLSFSQREHILMPSHLSALIQAFRPGRDSVPTQKFVECVLDTAHNHGFPPRWRDAEAVASVALQQAYCSASSGEINWRRWVFSMVAMAFVGVPTVEQMEKYVANARSLLSESSRDAGRRSPCDVSLTHDEFNRLPLWFEDSSYAFPIAAGDGLVREIKQVVLELFSSDGKPTAQPASATPASSVTLLPMLLGWSAFPICAFDILPELATEFLPSYSRGLLRAFHALLSLEASSDDGNTVVSLPLVSKLLDVAGARVDDAKLSKTATDAPPEWTKHDWGLFLRFCGAYDRGIERAFLIRNVFEAVDGETPW